MAVTRKQIIRSSYRLLGGLILVYLLTRIDFHLLWDHVRQVRIWPLLLSALLVVPMTLGKAYRWRIFLRDYGIDLSLSQTLLIYFKGYSLGTVTPGQIGELVKIYEVQRLRPEAKREQVFWTILNDRVYDLSVLWLFCLPAFFLGRMPLRLPLWLLLAVAGLSIALAYCPNLPFRFVRRRRIVQMNRRYGLNLALSIAVTIVILVRSVLVFQAVRVPVSMWEVALFQPVVNVVSLLPISISGFGTREAVLIYFFAPFGVAAEQMMVVGLLMGLIFFILNGLIGSVLIALKR